MRCGYQSWDDVDRWGPDEAIIVLAANLPQLIRIGYSIHTCMVVHVNVQCMSCTANVPQAYLAMLQCDKNHWDIHVGASALIEAPKCHTGQLFELAISSKLSTPSPCNVLGRLVHWSWPSVVFHECRFHEG